MDRAKNRTKYSWALNRMEVRALAFCAVDGPSMVPSDRGAVPSRAGGRQPQTALPRVPAASRTSSQAPGKTGARGGWRHSGQLALGCTWCLGHLHMPRLTCGPQDFRRKRSTIFFPFSSFQLQLTFCVNSR